MLLITGATGQLGKAVVTVCERKKIPFKAFSHSELNISCLEDAHKIVASQYDCIINCAAYTAVDAAEDNVGVAYAANAYGPWCLASSRVPVIHISTDYVFDGASSSPYDVDDITKPLSVYGLSKRAGEIALLEGGFQGAIVRTAWVYSKAPGVHNFFNTILRLGKEHESLNVVHDQVGAPTRAEDLAVALVELYCQKAHLQPMHILHFTNSGKCSWFEFSNAILKFNGVTTCQVHPINSSEYPTKAIRPKFSVLSLKSIEKYGIHPRDWLEALENR